MGNAYLAVKALLDALEVEYVIPPFCGREALRLGSLVSPEEICLPFKINMGNYLQSIERGADTVVITGSCGPCRFGEYCELQARILRRLGRDVDFIVIERPSEIGLRNLLGRLKRVAGDSGKSGAQKLNVLIWAVRIMKRIDALEARAHMLAGYERNRGECRRLLHAFRRDAQKAKGPNEMAGVIRAYDRRLDAVKTDGAKAPVKIAIVGEIYTIIEPFANLYIEDRLMDYGVSTKRRLSPSWWAGNLLRSAFHAPSGAHRAARGYLGLEIGGHARECIGGAVLAKEEGFDGAIQIFPMGCMPEIVSKAILPSVAREKDFPVLSLVVDEMTGEAGFVTRLEAFVDLLERRRDRGVSGR